MRVAALFIIFAAASYLDAAPPAAKGKKKPRTRSNFARLADRPVATASQRQLHATALYHQQRHAEVVAFISKLPPAQRTRELRLLASRSLLDQGKAAEALKELQQADSAEAPDFRVDLLRAQALVNLRRYKEARRSLALVLGLRPNHAAAHYYYALTCAPEREWSQAVEHCQLALLNCEPNSPLAQKASVILLASLWKLDQLKTKKP